MESKGCGIDWFCEKTFWMDRNLIKGFLVDSGKEVSLYKIKVDDDLNLSLTKHKQNVPGLKFETWNETVERMNQHLQDIEQKSIEMLQDYCSHTNRMIINTNSTGKDSMVVTHLAKKAGLSFETYFNVTTLDVGESNRMAKQNGYLCIYPDRQIGGFYQYIKTFGDSGTSVIPSRLNRFCCNYFKESPTINFFDANAKLLFLFGMRNQESAGRSNYQDIWKNEKWGNRDWIALLPIRQWTEFDVWLYIIWQGIQINDKYRYGYDRVGCGIACPNYTKYTWVLDQFWYPYLYARWRKILKDDFIANNKWIIMNCTIDEYVKKGWPGGVYRAEPTQQVVEEFASYNGLEKEIASKYFDRYCANGCINKRRQPLKIKDKNTISMNMKMSGRDTNRFLCKKCLMKEFGWNKDEWDGRVAAFKKQGCQLF